jgi:hypothetical protein
MLLSQMIVAVVGVVGAQYPAVELGVECLLLYVPLVAYWMLHLIFFFLRRDKINYIFDKGIELSA